MPGILALDTSSAVVSVAVARSDGLVWSDSVPQRDSSPVLLRLIDEVLRTSGIGLLELDGMVALRGPGSFTGLRIGLATTLGLHQSTGLPATAISTLACLAAAAPGAEQPILATVQALRGTWFAQRFGPGSWPQAIGDPSRALPQELGSLAFGTLVGHGVGALARDLGLDVEAVLDPGPLASVAALLAARHPPEWSSDLLTRPLYLSDPAVTVPGRPKSLLGG